jgi:hypothetical protein
VVQTLKNKVEALQIMKTLEKLLEKATIKGHAKSGAWEIEQVQGEFIRLKHYGQSIIQIDFTSAPVSYVENITSQSDTRGVKWMKKQFRLLEYPNSLKGFKEWLRDTPTPFTSDDVPGSHVHTYDKETKVYTESLKRVSFIDGSVLPHSSSYVYDKETKRFKNI